MAIPFMTLKAFAGVDNTSGTQILDLSHMDRQ